MPYKEIEYDVLGVLYKPVERRSTEFTMRLDDLIAETGLDRDTLASALLSLELKNWVALTKVLYIIAQAKITPEGRLEYERRRFLGSDNN